MPATGLMAAELAAQDKRMRREGWLLVVAAVAAVAGSAVTFAATFVLMDAALSTGGQARAQACDRAVGALLESREVVEVQRAGILIRELRCNVSRRLPQE